MTFAHAMSQSKNAAVEFVRHSLYDQEFRTVECGRCGKKVSYDRFLMSGICKDCACEEDRIDMMEDVARRKEEHEFMTTHQNDNMTSSL